jgi:anti-sigma factor RsiW
MSDPHRHATRLDALLDRELEPSAETEAAGHVATCATCRRIAETNALLGGLLDEPLAEVPPGFVRATVSRAVAARRPVAPLWWVSLPVSWRVSFAALLLLAPLAGYRAGRPAVPAARSAHELAWRLESPEVTAMQVRTASLTEVSP